MSKKLLSLFLVCALPIALLAGSGDVNGDSKVNVADIVAIIKIIAAGGYDEKADVNHDNKVSEEDVLVVTKIIFN